MTGRAVPERSRARGGAPGRLGLDKPAMRRALVLIVSIALGACGGSEPGRGDAAPTAGAAATAGGRAISDPARETMKQTLVGETARKRAWILSQPGDAEVVGVVEGLRAVFQETGWEVTAGTVSGMNLKPGIMVLVAEEQYPPYVDTVLKALEQSGLGAKSAAGYRAYYDEKKKENPSWPGIPMQPDQDFVIVVGPKPAA